jgi:hypothetical protein
MVFVYNTAILTGFCMYYIILKLLKTVHICTYNIENFHDSKCIKSLTGRCMFTILHLSQDGACLQYYISHRTVHVYNITSLTGWYYISHRTVHVYNNTSLTGRCMFTILHLSQDGACLQYYISHRTVHVCNITSLTGW